ncbi:MAG: aspartate-semialdehyde dehydrogenase, partial [Bacteroidota bacterium]
MKLAIIGATGLVGTEMLKVLEERQFPFDELLLVASAQSVGKEITFKHKTYKCIDIEAALAQKPDLALFSAGSGISKEYAPQFAERGTTVVDNSSAWRMHPDYKLIVPEINAHLLKADDKIIANPNCSTIQMVVVLNPLHQAFGIKRVVVSTYQSVTGTGKDAVDQLMSERENKTGKKVYPHPIDFNALPHIDVFLDNDYTREEMKMVKETQKIMGDENIALT